LEAIDEEVAVSRIFINYRREDTRSQASRLYEGLAKHYGDEQVFMDVDAIEPGLDWAEAIERAVGTSDVVLALIGKGWLDELHRREQSPPDFVRHELEAALRRDIRVIPVLVDGAAMPTVDDLPEELASLTRRQGFDLTTDRWQWDSEQLLKRLDRVFGITEPDPTPTREPEPPVHEMWPPPPPKQTAVRAEEPDVADELNKWNWGAFLLGPFWGLGNSVARSFLTLIPIYGIYEWILLGQRGNRWAWERRQWESLAAFRKTQRKWAMWGAVVDVVILLVIIGSSSGS
jgi:hypothetical protein